MQYQDDILALLDEEQTQKNAHAPQEVSLEAEKISHPLSDDILSESPVSEDIFSLTQETPQETLKQNKNTFGSRLVFFIKYISTSAAIFAVLLLVSNYSAYWNIAKSVIFAGELEQTKNSLIESVAAANLQDKNTPREEVDTFGKLVAQSGAVSTSGEKHSISELLAHNTDPSLNIEITPYENRIVIPKIGKNIPLLDITHPNVQGVDELNDIFMKELENGVIRYPGSAKPGEVGNSFIFGHSSNFPWMKGDYNDVFALLDKVVFDDEVIVYYGQEKYVYKIRAKNVIRPGDVSVLRNNTEKGVAQISLMTCWPIGTTLNRLVLTGDLVRIEK